MEHTSPPPTLLFLRLGQCERCFVHIDYMARQCDDHDPLTPLEYKTHEAASMPPRYSLPQPAAPAEAGEGTSTE